MAERIRFELTATDKTKRAFASVRRGMGGLQKSAASLKTAFVGLLSVLAIRAAFRATVGAALPFNRALAEASTLLEGTTEQMDEMAKAARDMAGEFGGTGATQLKAFYQAISAGVGTVGEATTLLDIANKLAIGGIGDLTASVDVLTTAINNYGKAGLTAQRAADILFSGVKFGKALDLDTLVPTPNRGFVKIRDIKDGDKIFDENGDVITVEIAHDVIENAESYEVTFSDGSVVLACADHNWLTYTDEDRRQLQKQTEAEKYCCKSERKLKRHRKVAPTVKTTKEILNDFSAKGRFKFRHYVQTPKAVQFEEKDFEIDPYILGLWLGDGASATARISTIDNEILESIRCAGYLITKITGDNCDYGIRRDMEKFGSAAKSLHTQLGEHNLLGNKRIPESYHVGGIDQRLALLQGLMDTDGTISTRGHCEFVSTNKNLAYGVRRLVNSLGMRVPGITIKEPKKPAHKLAYRVHFTPTKYNPFRLARKADRVKSTYGNRCGGFIGISNIKKVHNRPMRCLTVSGSNSLFLIGNDFIVTHNTTIGELGAAIGRTASLAADAGVSFEELVAATAALTTTGISTKEAITGIRAILAAVIKPGDEARQMAKDLRIEFSAAGLKAKGLAGFLADLTEKTGGSVEVMAKLFGGMEALAPIISLTGAVAEKFAEALDGATNAGGDMEEAYRKVADELEQRFRSILGDIGVAIERVGTSILKVLVPAMEFLRDHMGRIAITAGVAATALTIAMAPAFLAAAVAAGRFVLALVATRAALIRTGIGALVIIAGELAFQFLKLVERIGGFSNAMVLMRDVAIEVWDRIKMTAESMILSLRGKWLLMRGTFAIALSDMMESWGDFIAAIGVGAARLGMERFAADMWAAADGIQASSREAFKLASAIQMAGRNASVAAREMALAAGAPLESLKLVNEEIARQTAEIDASETAAKLLADALKDIPVIAMGAGGAIVEAFEDAAEATESLAKSMAKSIGDGFRSMVDGTKTVAQAFRAMAHDIISQLFDILVVQKLVAGISEFIGGMFGGGGAPTRSLIPIARPKLFHAGGVVGQPGPGRMVPAMAFAGAPRMHSGGVAGLRADEVPAILQRGERVIPKGGGGGITINQTINIETGVSQTVRAEMMGLLPQFKEVAKAGVLEGVRRGGAYGQAFG